MLKNIIKKVIVGLIGVTMVVSLVSCGNKSASITDEIKKSGKIILATNPEFAPFEFLTVENGKDKIVGADIMLAEEIAKDLGVKLDVRSLDFDGLIADLNAGNVDMVIAGMNPTPSRSKNVAFSDLYYEGVPQVFLINKNNADKIKTKEDLKGLKIGAQKGSVQEDVVTNELKDSVLHAIPNIPNLIQELKNNTIDALVLEKPIAEEVFKKQSSDLLIAPFEVNVDYSGYAVAIKKGNEDLVEAVNKTIKKVNDQKLMEKFIKDAQALNEKK